MGALTYAQALDVVQAARAEGWVSRQAAAKALRDWARTGRLVLTVNDWDVEHTPQAAACDCGKGILCPSNPQRPSAALRAQHRRYVAACAADGLDAHPLQAWLVHGRPLDALGSTR